MPSTVNVLREVLRQATVNDMNFYAYKLMFFELKIPSQLAVFAQNGSYLFPLKVPPDSYSLEEPFTVEASATQGGGVYVEENGIAQRVIRISGVTGFKPRPLNGNGPLVMTMLSPEKKSYTRNLPPFVIDDISGQRHFQYLQDAVFRTYADLKRDPTTAEDTKLMLHIPKDDEHWLVVPQRFQLERTASDRVMYRYTIELLVVDKAEAVDEDFSEDGSWIESISNAINTVNAAIQLAQGALNDLTALAAEIEGYVDNVATVLDGVAGIIDAASRFVEGVTDLIESPLAILNSLGNIIDSADAFLSTWEESGQSLQNLDDKVKDKWNKLGEALEMLGTQPEAFEPTPQGALARANNQVNPLKTSSAEALATAKARPPATSLMDFKKLGTALTAGDLQEAKANATFQLQKPVKYRSAKQVSLSAGDTLASLAARHLNDARRWQDIAVINGLKPPFTNKHASLDLRKADEAAMPGVRGLGDRILIPSKSKGVKEMPNPATLGVKPEEPSDVRFLGRDFRLELVTTISNPGNPLYDIPIDVARGSQDLQTIQGVANLAQGLTNRVTTEKGTDLLYKRLGMQRIVGTKQVGTDLEMSRFRAIQALQQDPRIARVRKLTFQGIDPGTTTDVGTPPDALLIDSEVEVRGFTESANVRITV